MRSAILGVVLLLGCGSGGPGDPAGPVERAAQEWCACRTPDDPDCVAGVVELIHADCEFPEETADYVLMCLEDKRGIVCPQRVEECGWLDLSGEELTCRR